MSLIVQDSSGSVSGANSYVTVAEFKVYHDDRGNDWVIIADSDTAIEQALIQATDYLDQRFTFVGKRKQGRQQSTEWPRINAWDIGRYYINDIPIEIKEAVNEYAFRALSAPLISDPDRDSTGGIIQSKSESVGPLSESVTYVGGAAYTMPKYPAADMKLKKTGLVISGGTVLRG